MHYLNCLEQFEISLISNAMLGERLMNLTEIQTLLADWLHNLHMRMVHQKMHINCEEIRSVLKIRNKPIPKVFHKEYLSFMMQKFVGVMEHVLGMFDKAIHNENEVDRKKKAEKKKAEMAKRNMSPDHRDGAARKLQRLVRSKHLRRHRHFQKSQF